MADGIDTVEERSEEGRSALFIGAERPWSRAPPTRASVVEEVPEALVVWVGWVGEDRRRRSITHARARGKSLRLVRLGGKNHAEMHKQRCHG